MALFGKKEEGPKGPPTDLVISMRQQGLNDNQIIQSLQRDGYPSHVIFDAMSQADIKGQMQQAQAFETEQMDTVSNPMTGGMPPQQQPPIPPQPQQEMPPMAQPMQPQKSMDTKIEEVAEAIIEEKWNDLIKQVAKIVQWKTDVEAKIAKIEQSVTNLNNNFDNLQKAVLGKISSYDENITEVGTEVKAMGKVFEKILPTLTESVSKLSKISGTPTITEQKTIKHRKPKMEKAEEDEGIRPQVTLGPLALLPPVACLRRAIPS